MSLFSTINTAASGLRAASTGINVTSHNVSNASVEGYTRRSLTLATADAVDRYGVGLGTGVRTTSVSRLSNFMINQRLIGAVGREAESESRLLSLGILEANFDEYGSEGPATLMDSFFDSLSEMTRDPSNVAYRKQALTTGTRFTDSLNRMATDLQSFRDDAINEMEDTVDIIQGKLDLIADFNSRTNAASTSLGKGDFADQRDQLIAEVSQTIGGSVRFTADGLAQYFVGGHAVVTGAEARDLTVTKDASGSPKLNLSTGSGTVDLTNLIGGRFGGQLSADSEAAGYLDDLNTLAATLATAFNTQHAAGFDSTGTAGGTFFTTTASMEAATIEIDAALLADPGLLAAAGAATAAAGDSDNLFLMMGIESSKLFSAGTLDATEFLGGIYSDVGRATATAKLDHDSAQYVLEDLSALRDSVSGVDLDEEATNLLGWQAAYEASSRVVSTANAVLGELMDMVR